jgi:hypothetical protein
MHIPFQLKPKYVGVGLDFDEIKKIGIENNQAIVINAEKVRCDYKSQKQGQVPLSQRATKS